MSITHHTPAQEAKRYIKISIAASIATILLKLLAWYVSGSVGLLSDALESFVNLAGAGFALIMITIAHEPPDSEHPFGHTKAEYFSSGFEGTLIFIAAAAILYAAIPRLLHPAPLDSLGIGLWFSAASTALNLSVAILLKRAAQRLRSIALEADSRHLMTDVWTSIGVISGLIAVAISGWLWLDALIAIGVALHILIEGSKLMRASVDGLMDKALPTDELEKIKALLNAYATQGAHYSELKTRLAGSQRFVHLNVLVPGNWQVEKAHDLLDDIESKISQALEGCVVTTHLEPLPDQSSHNKQHD